MASDPLPPPSPTRGTSWSCLPLELRQMIMQHLIPFSALAVSPKVDTEDEMRVVDAEGTPVQLWSLFRVGFSFADDISKMLERSHYRVLGARSKLSADLSIAELNRSIAVLVQQLQMAGSSDRLAAAELAVKSLKEALLPLSRTADRLASILKMYKTFRERRGKSSG